MMLRIGILVVLCVAAAGGLVAFLRMSHPQLEAPTLPVTFQGQAQSGGAAQQTMQGLVQQADQNQSGITFTGAAYGTGELPQYAILLGTSTTPIDDEMDITNGLEAIVSGVPNDGQVAAQSVVVDGTSYSCWETETSGAPAEQCLWIQANVVGVFVSNGATDPQSTAQLANTLRRELSG